MKTVVKPKFHLGDRVKVDFGIHSLAGEVIEERGPIGVRGRYLYQVSIPLDPFDPMIVESGEDEMQSNPDVPSSQQIQTAGIRDYLVQGGLISILHANLAGGRNQPRAWLCIDQLGGLTHTFIPERGLLGGVTVPSSALHAEKISSSKRDEVLSFIQSFGLNHGEAEFVISKIGVAP